MRSTGLAAHAVHGEEGQRDVEREHAGRDADELLAIADEPEARRILVACGAKIDVLKKQLDEVLVDRRRRRLHDEHVGAADVLVDLERDLAVGEPAQPGLPERNAQKVGDLLGQPVNGLELLHRLLVGGLGREVAAQVHVGEAEQPADLAVAVGDRRPSGRREGRRNPAAQQRREIARRRQEHPGLGQAFHSCG